MGRPSHVHISVELAQGVMHPQLVPLLAHVWPVGQTPPQAGAFELAQGVVHWQLVPLLEHVWPAGHVPPQAGAVEFAHGVMHPQLVPSLEHTWPAQGATTATSGPNQVGHIEAYGGLVLYSVYRQYVGGDETMHVLDPATGKDAVVGTIKAFGANREWAIGSRGLVYAVNSRPNSTVGAGRIVFVSTARISSRSKVPLKGIGAPLRTGIASVRSSTSRSSGNCWSSCRRNSRTRACRRPATRRP